jgi:hypothetical protein
MTTIGCPSNIEVLLWCHLERNAHPKADAPAINETIKEFLSMGVIETVDAVKGVYKTTPLGDAWVQALCNVKVPQPAFVDEQGRVLQDSTKKFLIDYDDPLTREAIEYIRSGKFEVLKIR